MVDITNDGQQSSTDLVILSTARPRASPTARRSRHHSALDGIALYVRRLQGQRSDLGTPTQSGSWLGNSGIQQFYFGFREQLGALLTFKPCAKKSPTLILVRIGISFISSTQSLHKRRIRDPDVPLRMRPAERVRHVGQAARMREGADRGRGARYCPAVS
ncbi:hypothetical protein BDW22DRAFT_30697 [Trametopsis cervina]|nr:hypothetical protein BDW22DRAFT_30697 [Trametopsis cervina]